MKPNLEGRASGPGCVLVCEACGQEFRRGSRGSVPRFCSDRCRKRSYAGTCVDCGVSTTGCRGPGKAPERCVPCTAAHRAIWSRETVIAAIRRFADRYGRPPVATDFNPWHARNIHQPEAEEKWERFFGDGDYPRGFTVQQLFGSWSAAIAAAGFPARTRGQRLSDERRREAKAA